MMMMMMLMMMMNHRPYDSRMWTAVGKVYQSTGQISQAIKCMERTASLAPSDPSVMKELARLYLELTPPSRDKVRLRCEVSVTFKAAVWYEKQIQISADEPQDHDTLEACAFLAEFFKVMVRCRVVIVHWQSKNDLANAQKYASVLVNHGGKV
jgi:hypothetical protein